LHGGNGGGYQFAIPWSEPVEEFWQAWDHPGIWRLPHGHISWMGVPGLIGRILRWLAPLLDKPAIRTSNV
jgi:hypothetical protein